MDKQKAKGSRPRPEILQIKSKFPERLTKFKSKITGIRRISDEALLTGQLLWDLREGSTESLVRYLRKHRGIPDSLVADELVNLLAGPPDKTQFRLAVIRHPLLPKRTKKRDCAKMRLHLPSETDLAIVAHVENLSLTIGKKMALYLQVQKDLNITPYRRREAMKRVEAARVQSTLKAAIAPHRDVADYEALRNSALTKLRKSSQADK